MLRTPKVFTTDLTIEDIKSMVRKFHPDGQLMVDTNHTVWANNRPVATMTRSGQIIWHDDSSKSK